MSMDRLQLRTLGLSVPDNSNEARLSSQAATDALDTWGTESLPLIADDLDLVPLLRQASNEELAPLVRYITEKGDLTAQIQRTKTYRQYSATGNHSKYADDIAAEIQKFGANTLCSAIFRSGKGVRYREIVIDVAKRCKVSAGPSEPIEKIEMRILLAVFSKAYERMTAEERGKLLDTLRIHRPHNLTGPIAVAAIQAAIQSTGFAPYMLAVIMANGAANALLGHGLAFATNAALTKGIAVFAGPVGWAFDGFWISTKIAGPAYRVTLPCVVQVAAIRQSRLRKRNDWSKLAIGVAIVSICLLALIVALYIRQ